jgi:hypothetical protein
MIGLPIGKDRLRAFARKPEGRTAIKRAISSLKETRSIHAYTQARAAQNIEELDGQLTELQTALDETARMLEA